MKGMIGLKDAIILKVKKGSSSRLVTPYMCLIPPSDCEYLRGSSKYSSFARSFFLDPFVFAHHSRKYINKGEADCDPTSWTARRCRPTLASTDGGGIFGNPLFARSHHGDRNSAKKEGNQRADNTDVNPTPLRYNRMALT